MSRCLTEVVWRDSIPICYYGRGGVGNVCDEPYGNFVELPFEPVLWRFYGWLKRLGWVK